MWIDEKRLLERIRFLGTIGADSSGGRTRLAASGADKEARDTIAGWMKDTGLKVKIDKIGNIFGIWETELNRGEKPFMMGSHIDTVIHAGQYDGCYGVIAAIEVIDALKNSGFTPARPVVAAVFTNEEGVRYAPDMMGSLVYAGGLSAEEALSSVGTDGTILGEELQRIGYAGMEEPGFLKPYAYVELHIEQGPILDAEHISIGAVENLQGISWHKVTVNGIANHAGTTPVSMRADAGLAAAKTAVFLRERCMRPGSGSVITVGKMEFHPGAVNVIPSQAVFTVDLRNPDAEQLREEERALEDYLHQLERNEGITVSKESLARFEPVQFDEGIVRMIESAAGLRGLSCRRITSGAGQDAQMMARICPAAMIFVPSVDGISHNPKEYTRPRELAAGANILLDVAERLCRMCVTVLPQARQTDRCALSGLEEQDAEAAGRFHETLPGYRPSPLISLDSLAKKLGVKGIYVKDEAVRFGLGAFKGLGGAYAMYRILCERLCMDPDKAGFSCFQQADVKEQISGITFITATDGNHGKGVSWAAGLFGCRAVVYMPSGSSEERAAAIRRAGPAEVEITDRNYDETVAYAKRISREKGWILIQDTAWDGYEQIPLWIIQGYLTMGAEAAKELESKGLRPTHVFLQAGVGAMAGGICGYLMNHYKDCPPGIYTVEPETVPCIFLSAEQGDGKAHSVEGNPITIMAGLNCGTPCKITWPILRDYAAGFIACPDAVTIHGMRSYAAPVGHDPRIVSGESGAVTMGVTRLLLEDERFLSEKQAMGLDQDSVILLFNTEGATDPVSYQKLLQDWVL